MAAASDEEASLLNSPTWAIALTCFVFIAISILFEKLIELAEHLMHKYKQASLHAAFHKIKDELLLVGFISVALTVGQSTVAKICVPKKAATTMLLCKIEDKSSVTSRVGRILAGAAYAQECSEGQAPFIPTAGFHKLHIFIFILAVVHIFYSLSIVALGMCSVRYWKSWEARAAITTDESSHGGARLAKETTFSRERILLAAPLAGNPIIAYVIAFFRQFYSPVSETDYITLRNGFIQDHTPGYLQFNFHKYIKRSLQDDFQHVVGISPILWLFSCVWLLINVEGWETKLWTAFISFFLVLIVGTKLQFVMTTMALRFRRSHSVTVGVAKVKPSDDLFWFNRPHFTLWCIHFIVFQNALDLSFVLWVYFQFSDSKCVYQKKRLLIARLAIGLVTQAVLGVATLPSYALVSQMGTHLKKTMFEKDIQLALRKWHERAKHHLHEEGRGTHHEQNHSHAQPSHLEISLD